ncbi:MAG: xanthine dehydrogenase family protein molybdopterin-binding subunit [Granulosicoccus sp.]|nr:xanthine dehydrogenase family protein molybdopterin-binding subunit [Granulosicoccus sp.]
MNQKTERYYPAEDYKWVGSRPIRPDGVPKVCGTAKFGNDYSLPDMLHGKYLRSPHAHARIVSIDTSRAEALPGVKAVVTGKDFPDHPFAYSGIERMEKNLWHTTRNMMAREKALYEGHPVAAVAAVDIYVAEEAVELIDVVYEILPHVIGIDEALAPDAPLLFEDMFTRNVDPKPDTPSNLARRAFFEHGETDNAFGQADVIVERSFKTEPVHQGYIEPHACLAHYQEDGQSDMYTASQGHFDMRSQTAALTGMKTGDIRAIPAEIGGGFGGKTLVYVEPVAMQLSRLSGRPVKLAMNRSEVFRASGPTSGIKANIKIGAKKDGTIVAADAEFYYQAGAFPGSPFVNGCFCAFAPYAIPNKRTTGWDVVSNRPKVAAYRAPGAPMANFPVESVLDILAKELAIDPVDLRLKNSVELGDTLLSGLEIIHEGNKHLLQALKDHPGYNAPLGPNQGRGMAMGYWHNAGGESGATVYVSDDGTVTVATGSPDIGGSRASMAMMAADTFGIDYSQVRSLVNDTTSVPYTFLTGGSRVTFATGKAVIGACEKVILDLRTRAAGLWGVDVEAVDWVDGEARPSSSNVGTFEPLTLAELAAKAGATGGPLGTSNAVNATGHAPGFSTSFCDVEVDPETGKITILRYVVAQDAGRAIHPSYVEGQMQGAVVQGIGWALNEEYIYGEDGVQQNPGFLDYRMPVASDLPMIETLVVEVPNPYHPFGVKGVAEAGMVASLATVANAVADATKRRMTSLPLSPPRMLKALKENRAAEQ